MKCSAKRYSTSTTREPDLGTAALIGNGDLRRQTGPDHGAIAASRSFVSKTLKGYAPTAIAPDISSPVVFPTRNDGMRAIDLER